MNIPDTPAEIFAGMPGVFRQENARDMRSTFQFEISGDGGGSWALSIADGRCLVTEGVADAPSVTIAMDAVDFVAMIRGELNAVTAFMTGRVRLSGDMMLAMRLPDLFYRPD